MDIQRVKFERVFDVQHFTRALSNRPFTEFSFEHAGHKRYAVLVPGRPRIVTGDVVTVVLRNKGNWQSLAGWKNHTTGQLVLPPVGHALGAVAQSACLSGIFLLNYHITGAGAGRAFAGAAVLFCFFMTVAHVLQWRQMKKFAKAIEHLDDAA